MKINLIRTDVNRGRVDPEIIKVNDKAKIATIGKEVAERLGVNDGESSVMIGNVGSLFYIAKKLPGFFGPKVARQAKGPNFQISIPNEVRAGLKSGEYILGESVISEENDAQNRKVSIKFYRLEKL